MRTINAIYGIAGGCGGPLAASLTRMHLARRAPLRARCSAEAIPTFEVPADAEPITPDMVDRTLDE